MSITVSPGKLDGLLNETFPVADFTSVSVQSVNGATASATGAATYSSANLITTGVQGPGTIAGEVITVVGFNDTQNSITFALTLDGQSITQVTDFIDGYSSSGLLISGLNVGQFAGTPLSTLNNLVGVLSSSPIPAQTNLTFTPNGSWTIGVTPTVTPTPTAAPTPTPAPTSTGGFSVLDTTTGQPVSVGAQLYSGPVAGVQEQFVDVTADNLNVTVTTPNWFLHSGSGNDALAASSGTNVLDGGTGSNFLTGGSGTDTFFVDDRSAPADIWSTVNNFHTGDAATIFGVTPGSFSLSWVDGQGASGFTGLTLHATAAGVPTASLTLVGFTSADLNDGRLSVSYGTTGGSSYMYVHDNS
jgi:hypothetical protein